MAFQYNGGSILGMAGKECVCIASDNRYGQNLHTISTDFPKIFKITNRIFLGLSGLATDIQVWIFEIFNTKKTLYSKIIFENPVIKTVLNRIKYRLSMYELKEGREMSPECFKTVVSNLLYERRYV
mgnify:CR=1 FL=1